MSSVSTDKVAPASVNNNETDLGNPHIRRLQRSLLGGGDRNLVLGNNRLALVHFQLGQYPQAHRLFSESASKVSSFYNDDVWAARATNTFTNEAIKDFKGDAYERSMLFYYLGLSNLARGETDSARAALKNAFIQDTFAEDEKYRADFYLMPLLESWLLHCEGRSQAAMEKFQTLPEQFEAFSPTGNGKRFFTILETGKSPQKDTAGRYSNLLVYRSQTKEDASYNAKGQSSSTSFGLGGDVLFQAATRGGRVVDAVIDGKVQFREGAESMRSAMLGATELSLIVAADLAVSGDDEAAIAAAAIAGVALVASVVSDIAAQSAATKADTRYWDNLPGKIYLHSASEPTESIIDGEGNVIKAVTLFENSNCRIDWSRKTPSWSIPSDPPNWGVYQ